MDDYRYCEASEGEIHYYRRVGRGHYESACGMERYGKTPGGYVGHAKECQKCLFVLVSKSVER